MREDEHNDVLSRDSTKDLILSILRAKPSLRDSKGYLASFGTQTGIAVGRPPPPPPPIAIGSLEPPVRSSTVQVPLATIDATESISRVPVLPSILDQVVHRTALVKIQGPFEDGQLSSIARVIVYLEKLGLVSIIVVDGDRSRAQREEHECTAESLHEDRQLANDLAMGVTVALERQGARARPILHPVVRLGTKKGEEHFGDALDAHKPDCDLVAIRSTLKAGEIPVLPPLAMDSSCRALRVDSNHVIASLARNMALVPSSSLTAISNPSGNVNLTPVRLLIINNEGGIPSPTANGLPRLLINLGSEYTNIRETLGSTRSQAFSNLCLAKQCLDYMPSSASAMMVSHRSSSSLIRNLITNKPAFSASLPHAILSGGKLTPDTPTLLRRGLPIQVLKTTQDIDKIKMTNLLEKSFGRTLDYSSFYSRLEERLDIAIIAGDYVGAAIITREHDPDSPSSTIFYLDKFAVLPSHQGDGTVDFLWVALRDESYGLGLTFNGTKKGEDLVWRSRANNPINKWYFERSSGHVRMDGEGWVLFWCDAERSGLDEELRACISGTELGVEEIRRAAKWCRAVKAIPCAWK